RTLYACRSARPPAGNLRQALHAALRRGQNALRAVAHHPSEVTMRFLLILWCAVAFAQDYPAKNVTIIVPYPAGGPTDQLGRLLAPRFAEKLGRSFIVENVTGGGTTIGTGRVARAAPDGHTLLLHNLQISANVALYPKLPYDTERDLVPVAFINRNPLVLVGRKTLAPNTLAELIG